MSSWWRRVSPSAYQPPPSAEKAEEEEERLVPVLPPLLLCCVLGEPASPPPPLTLLFPRLSLTLLLTWQGCVGDGDREPGGTGEEDPEDRDASPVPPEKKLDWLEGLPSSSFPPPPPLVFFSSAACSFLLLLPLSSLVVFLSPAPAPLTDLFRRRVRGYGVIYYKCLVRHAG